MTVAHSLTLDYQLQPGWLAPYVKGLQKGIAMARRCSACKKVSFPPVRVCDCRSSNGAWVYLSGEARLVYHCDGADGSFALVRFEGADTSTVVRLKSEIEIGQIGYLQASESGNPALELAHGPGSCNASCTSSRRGEPAPQKGENDE